MGVLLSVKMNAVCPCGMDWVIWLICSVCHLLQTPHYMTSVSIAESLSCTQDGGMSHCHLKPQTRPQHGSSYVHMLNLGQM